MILQGLCQTAQVMTIVIFDLFIHVVPGLWSGIKQWISHRTRAFFGMVNKNDSWFLFICTHGGLILIDTWMNDSVSIFPSCVYFCGWWSPWNWKTLPKTNSANAPVLKWWREDVVSGRVSLILTWVMCHSWRTQSQQDCRKGTRNHHDMEAWTSMQHMCTKWLVYGERLVGGWSISIHESLANDAMSSIVDVASSKPVQLPRCTLTRRVSAYHIFANGFSSASGHRQKSMAKLPWKSP